MASRDFAANVFGWAGTIAAIILIFIPIFMMYDMFKTKSTTRVTYLLFITTLINSFFWFIYGFIIISYPIIVTNGIGGLMSMIYLICFIAYVDFSLTKRLLMIAGIVLLVTIGQFIGLYFLSTWEKEMFGIIIIITNCLLFIGPIQKIVQTFQESDNSYIPIEIVIALLVNTIIWIIYGIFLHNDINIIIPNVLGLILMVLEFCVWCFFYYYTKGLKKATLNMNHKKTDDETRDANLDETNDNENKPLII